jgi:tetratricopeptide (TPR) repeat protein
MALHGELKNMPLPDILQSLKANQQSGTLRLQDGKKEFALFFETDSITSVNPGRPSREYLPPIVCLFLNITEERMEREFKKKLKLSIAERLHKSRIAGAAKINALHRVYLTEFLYEAFAWQSGSFRFEDGKVPDPLFDDDQLSAGLKLDVDRVLFESMRRADEWKLIAKNIPTMDDVFTVVEEFRPQVDRLAEPIKAIFTFCNGENSVKEIAYRSGQDLFTTAKILGDSLESRTVRRIAPNDLIALAEKAFANNKNDEALRYFKRAIELDRGNTDVRRRFADLCMQTGMKNEATNEYKTLAQLAREKQDYDRAKSFYRQIIAVNPSEYEFQKRLYEMLREIKDPEAEACGLALADTLKRLGLRNEEVQILGPLIEDHADDAALIERMGDAEQSLGHNKAAVDNYYNAAELSAKRGDPPQACKNYDKILAINPNDAKAQKKLDELQSGLYLKNRQRRRRILVIAECTAGFVVVCVYLAYLAVSIVDYLNVRNSNLRLVAKGDFTSMQEAVSSFEKKHPFSLVKLDVQRYRLEIERLRSAGLPTAVPAAADTSPKSAPRVTDNQAQDSGFALPQSKQPHAISSH